jgi:competence protein ComEC
MALIGFAAAAAGLQMQPALPSLAVIGLASAAFLLWLAAWRRLALRVRPAARGLAGLLTGAVIGFLWAAWLACRALAPQLAAGDEGRDIKLVGTIDNLPYRFSQGARFNFAVESAEADVPPRIALSWYSGYRDQLNEVPDVQPGERWQLTVRLQRPHGNANPYCFDYEAWLLEQGLRATGYVRVAPDNRRLDGFVFSVGNMVERSRAALRARILAALPGKPYAGVIVALVVGDQRGIDQADWLVFNRTGIGHLISISGLHITMVAGLFALAAFTLWRWSFFTRAQLPLLLPAQKVAALVGAAMALLYVLLAGFGVPAQRTLYMLMVVAMALWLNRLTSISHVLCTALGVVVVIDPWAVLWPGFWLSFGAVAIILYATVGRTTLRPARRNASLADSAGGSAPAPHVPVPPSLQERFWQTLRVGAHTQYAVTLGLVPMTMLLFGQVSVVSPLANAVAIPLISLIVTPLALIGSMLPSLLAVPLLGLAHGLVAALAECLQWFSAMRYAVWSAPVPPFWLFCWAMLGTVWLLAPRGWPVRWLGLASWIPLLAAEPSHPAPGRMTVTAFDVGQGMALLIETGKHRLLYDTGPAYSPESNAGNRIILPYLRARGIGALDGVIVSHSDADHSGGALTVLDGVSAAWVLSSLPPQHAIARASRQHIQCAAGQSWTWDGVRFEILHPLPASYADTSLKPNARGCTVKITAGAHSMLLAGDIEADQEQQLVSRDAARLRADVLLAPHHGSGTSSTRDFLMAVRPRFAIFQVGHRNRYRHPKQEVFERYGAMQIQRYRTDQLGAITLDFGDTIEVSAYRHSRARYWHAR